MINPSFSWLYSERKYSTKEDNLNLPNDCPPPQKKNLIDYLSLHKIGFFKIHSPCYESRKVLYILKIVEFFKKMTNNACKKNQFWEEVYRASFILDTSLYDNNKGNLEVCE